MPINNIFLPVNSVRPSASMSPYPRGYGMYFLDLETNPFFNLVHGLNSGRNMVCRYVLA
jgi:hypothetical protein